MTYVNPLLGLGWESFAHEARAAGLSGVIVPDLPMEEGEDLEHALAAEGIDLIYLAAPTTSDDRLGELGRRSRGFLYLVSVTGVTGARDRLPDDLADFVTRARRATELPLCLGFGIKNAALARDAARLVDGVIVGSALVDTIRAAGEDGRAVGAVGEKLGELRRGVDAA
jgi:tryptophan synthase alpha chain